MFKRLTRWRQFSKVICHHHNGNVAIDSVMQGDNLPEYVVG